MSVYCERGVASARLKQSMGECPWSLICAAVDDMSEIPPPGHDGTRSTKWSAVVATGKDTVSLLRDSAIFLLALLLVAVPQILNERLTRAGFVETTVAWFKWQTSLVRSHGSLKDAQQALTSITAQNESLRWSRSCGTKSTILLSLRAPHRLSNRARASPSRPPLFNAPFNRRSVPIRNWFRGRRSARAMLGHGRSFLAEIRP